MVLPTPIPDKGTVLTQMSRFWFQQTGAIVRNHFLTMDLEDAVGRWESLQPLKGRAMVVEKARPLPIEAVVRGYLSGSAWKEYQQTGAVCGITAATRTARIRQTAQPGFHPFHQGSSRPARREYLV